MTDYKDPLTDPQEAFGKLEEGTYKAELDLVDRYQAFVAELVRLSLVGIGVFPFLYQSISGGRDIKPFVAWLPSPKLLAAIGVLCFGLCTACALIFRFLATEGARYYIEALRFFPQQEPRSTLSLNKRNRRIIFCRLSKLAAAWFFALGSGLIAIAFFMQVMNGKSSPNLQGIKVRLETGEVGRVQEIVETSDGGVERGRQAPRP